MSTTPKSVPAADTPVPPRNDAARDRHAFARRIDCDGGEREHPYTAPARGGGVRDGGDGDPPRGVRR